MLYRILHDSEVPFFSRRVQLARLPPLFDERSVDRAEIESAVDRAARFGAAGAPLGVPLLRLAGPFLASQATDPARAARTFPGSQQRPRSVLRRIELSTERSA